MRGIGHPRGVSCWRRHRLAVGHVPLWATLGILAAIARPSKGADENASVDPIVQQAIAAEAMGDPVEHQRLLKVSLSRDPGLPSANWQAGRVRAYGDWIHVKEAEKYALDDPDLATYRSMRSAAQGQPDRELKLARWCMEHHQFDLARLHYARLITENPADRSLASEAVRRTGIALVDGQLVTSEEVDQRLRDARKQQTAVDLWRPRLEKLANHLSRADDSLVNDLLARLQSDQDPQIIPAIDSFVIDAREDFGRHLLKKLATFPTLEATQVLVRYALLSPVARLRDAAIDELLQRPKHDYIPQVLAGLGYPIHATFRIVRNPLTGDTRYQHTFIQDGDQQTRVVRADHLSRPVRGRDGSDEALVTQTLKLLEQISVAKQRQAAAAIESDRIAIANARSFHLLERTTGQDLPREASRWRNWWVSYNESVPARTTSYQYIPTLDDYRASSGPSLGLTTASGSCFPPGTLVWTQLGRTPIEKIRPGDRVLAQDPDTGELAYKAVWLTTVNPPLGGLSRLTVDGDSVDLTDGHVVWVANVGWRMAKELESDAILHGVGTFFRLDQKQPIPSVRSVHNLVVADFHTFFVGESGILVHDITPRGHSRSLVPGFAAVSN